MFGINSEVSRIRVQDVKLKPTEVELQLAWMQRQLATANARAMALDRQLLTTQVGVVFFCEAH